MGIQANMGIQAKARQAACSQWADSTDLTLVMDQVKCLQGKLISSCTS